VINATQNATLTLIHGNVRSVTVKIEVMRKIVKVLYKNMAPVRDYEVKSCIKKNESMIVIYNNKEMTLSVDDLKNKRVSISGLMASRTGGRDYRLYYYNWEPNLVNHD
jgi:hypothetical protein